MYTTITSKDDFDSSIRANQLVVVDFYADWCPPCKQMAPIFEKFSKQYLDVVFLKVNSDDNGDVTSEHGVTALPTFKFFKDGKVFGSADNKDLLTLVGAGEKKLENRIKILTGQEPIESLMI